MRYLPTRLMLAGLMGVLWIGWAVWSNVPHFYDARAMQKQLSAALGTEKAHLQPATAGFPLAFMRYDYSDNNQLTVYSTEYSALLPNIVFSFACSLGVALLVVRTRRITVGGVALLCCLLLPAGLLYIWLNGLHPDVIFYLYAMPLIMLLIAVTFDITRKQRAHNQAMRPSREAGRIDNEDSLVAPG